MSPEESPTPKVSRGWFRRILGGVFALLIGFVSFLFNLLSNSCTINIVRYANKVGRVGRLDINHLLNGFIDQYLFSAGMIDTSLPFDELRRRSHINEAAQEAEGSPDFPRRIREAIGLPKF